MLRFSRPDASEETAPRITDGSAAKAWLARMAQPVSIENLDEIAAVLDALGAGGTGDRTAALEPQRKFAIAERIRALILPLLSERSREERFTVLPLDDDFSLQFWAAVHAAIALRDVYAWLVSQLPAVPAVADPVDDFDGGPAGHQFASRVGALQRALDVNAYVMLCIQRAHWAVPPALWERHCVLGQLVRDLDCQDIEIADAAKVSATKTCRAAVVLPVLIALADPAARSGVEFEMVRMAAQRWSAKVGFRLERREGDAPLPRPVAQPGPAIVLGACVLRLDTQSALHSIDKRVEALAEGRTPKEVGIGETLRSQQAAELLTLLRRRWSARSPTEIDSPERAWRAAPTASQVQAIVGMPGPESHAAPTGDQRSPQNPYAYHRMKQGAVTQPRALIESDRIDRLLEQAEGWTLVAEAADAVRCLRRHARPRIGLHRLVGLRLRAADGAGPAGRFLLGWVEALQATTVTLDDRRLRPSVAHTVRVRLAPGLPEWIHASIEQVDVAYAFLLVPGADAVLQPAGSPPPSFVTMLTDPEFRPDLLRQEGDGWDAVRAHPRAYGLVLPHAAFRAQQAVRAARGGVAATLRMEELMMRGSDFDLVRFSLL